MIDNPIAIGDKVERSLDNGETFSELPSLPTPLQGACLAVAWSPIAPREKDLFIIGGWRTTIGKPNPTTDMYVLHFQDNGMPHTEWVQKQTPMGVARARHGCSVIGTPPHRVHEIVVVGGLVGGFEATDSVEIFNTGDESWRTGKEKYQVILSN